MSCRNPLSSNFESTVNVSTCRLTLNLVCELTVRATSSKNLRLDDTFQRHKITGTAIIQHEELSYFMQFLPGGGFPARFLCDSSWHAALGQ